MEMHIKSPGNPQSAITSIADYHPLTLLQMFASSTKKPEEYLDAMPLHIALQQPDQNKFIDAMVQELKHHTELKHWKIVHKSQVPKSANLIPWSGLYNENMILQGKL